MYYTLSNGHPAAYPEGLDLAIKLRQPRYVEASKPCPVCHTEDPERYVVDQSCVQCARNALPLIPNYPESRHAALLAGLPSYYPPTHIMCKYGPHRMMKSVINGKCDECAQARTPRARAAAADRTYYTPGTLCSVCNTRAKRVTATDACTKCEPVETDARASVTVASDIAPVGVKRIAASQLGFRFYQTGTPCRRGHIALRYCSTGACVDCHCLTRVNR